MEGLGVDIEGSFDDAEIGRNVLTGFGEFEALFGGVPTIIANVYPCGFSTKILPEAMRGAASTIKYPGRRLIIGKFWFLFPRRPKACASCGGAKESGWKKFPCWDVLNKEDWYGGHFGPTSFEVRISGKSPRVLALMVLFGSTKRVPWIEFAIVFSTQLLGPRYSIMRRTRISSSVLSTSGVFILKPFPRAVEGRR